MKTLSFFVPGIPQPAGSKSGFAIKRGGVYTGQVAMSDANKKAKPWQRAVSSAAADAMAANEIGQAVAQFGGPVSLKLSFWLPRPKSHFGSGKNAELLKQDAPIFHTVRPDALKLGRAIEDALTGIVWRDDSQVCIESLEKRYVQHSLMTPGCQIEVTEAIE